MHAKFCSQIGTTDYNGMVETEVVKSIALY